MSERTFTDRTPKERLEGLRGAEYFDTWKTMWHRELSPLINAELTALKQASGKVTPADLVRMANTHALPFKTFIEQLEKDRVLRSGTFETLPPIGKMRKELGLNES